MTCPTCKGFCCRMAGFPVPHDPPFWEVLPVHVCPDCDDGTYEVCGDPEPFIRERSFKDERADVVAWLRANTCGCHDFAGDIERGEHVGAAKNKSSDDV